MESPADVKELIPEFFYFPEFLENMNGEEERPSKIHTRTYYSLCLKEADVLLRRHFR